MFTIYRYGSFLRIPRIVVTHSLTNGGLGGSIFIFGLQINLQLTAAQIRIGPIWFGRSKKSWVFPTP